MVLYNMNLTFSKSSIEYVHHLVKLHSDKWHLLYATGTSFHHKSLRNYNTWTFQVYSFDEIMKSFFHFHNGLIANIICCTEEDSKVCLICLGIWYLYQIWLIGGHSYFWIMVMAAIIEGGIIMTTSICSRLTFFQMFYVLCA